MHDVAIRTVSFSLMRFIKDLNKGIVKMVGKERLLEDRFLRIGSRCCRVDLQGNQQSLLLQNIPSILHTIDQ